MLEKVIQTYASKIKPSNAGELYEGKTLERLVMARRNLILGLTNKKLDKESALKLRDIDGKLKETLLESIQTNGNVVKVLLYMHNSFTENHYQGYIELLEGVIAELHEKDFPPSSSIVARLKSIGAIVRDRLGMKKS